MRRGFGFFFAMVLLISGCGAQEVDSAPTFNSEDVQDWRMFTLEDISGQAVSLDSVLKQNKAVLVNFWATWCPPCREEIPDLVALQERYKDRGFTVLGVDVGESRRKVAGFVEDAGINYPVLLDEEMNVARDYGIVGIPTSLLMNSQGDILGKYNGFPPRLLADVEEALL
jgi:thiol-disulfide isomerase/thioredoxin